MPKNDIQLDGDPRTLAKAILRAARETCREKHGDIDGERLRAELGKEIPELAKQMVDALERRVRDVYLTNALEVMALSYARQEIKRKQP